MMNIDSNFIITCPACGYSFKKPAIMPKGKRLTCPMCRYDMSSKFDDFTI